MMKTIELIIVSCCDYDKMILRSSLEKLVTTSSKHSFLDISLSTESTARFASLSSPMVERKYVLILFNDENDLSHCAVDTAMVRAIRTNLVSWGNASFNGKSANRT